jgi:hypothetical protein
MTNVAARQENDPLECCSHEAVACRIESEFVKPARDLTAVDETFRLCSQQVDTTTDARQNRLSVSVASREVPAHPPFDLPRQKSSDEIRQVGEIFLYQRVEAARETREIRRIEHEQPDIA